MARIELGERIERLDLERQTLLAREGEIDAEIRAAFVQRAHGA